MGLFFFFSLTDPEVVKPLAHGAALVGDLVEVLVETGLQRDEPGQRREVVFYRTANEHNTQPGQDAPASLGGRHGRRAAMDDRDTRSPAMTSTQIPATSNQVHRLSAPRLLRNQTVKGRNTSLNKVTLTAGHSKA